MSEPQLPEVTPGVPAVFRTSEPKPRIVFYDGADSRSRWSYKTEDDSYAYSNNLDSSLLSHADWFPLIPVDISASNPGMERIDDITKVRPKDEIFFKGWNMGYECYDNPAADDDNEQYPCHYIGVLHPAFPWDSSRYDSVPIDLFDYALRRVPDDGE